MRDYDAATKDLVAAAARDAGVHVRRGLRFTFATDALIPLRQGFRVAGLGSVNECSSPPTTTGRPTPPTTSTTRSVRDAVGDRRSASIAAAQDALARRLARERDAPRRAS